MKKYILLVLFSLFLASCSKKETILSGKIEHSSPLARMELIDPSSVATLPVANIGVDEKGNFLDTLTLEKDGVYALIYNGRVNFIYLEKGKNINITGNGANFPEDLKVIGDGQANNEFLIESHKVVIEYLSKIDVQVFTKNEADFIKEINKYADDIHKKLDEIAKNKKADDKVLAWKKGDVTINLLLASSQYERNHQYLTQNPDFKVSKTYFEGLKKLEKEEYVKQFDNYRQYLLTKLETDFRAFVTPFLEDTKTTRTEVFIKFLDTRKEFSQETKDYLIAFIAKQFDFYPQNEKIDQVMKVLQEKIKTENIKKELVQLFNTIQGVKIGDVAPATELIKQDGKTAKLEDLKGKPTLLVFYSSWAPNMVESIVPNLKEMSKFYQGKLDFAFINLDDNAKQFQSTSKAMMKDLTGTHLYAKGGLKSDLAKQFYIYGFKLPSFIVLDKDGKIASASFGHILEPKLLEVLEKQTGVSIPQQPEHSMELE